MTRRLALFATVAVLACGGGGSDDDDDDDGNPMGPPPGSGGATNGSLTATIGGANWSATGTITVNKSSPNFIGIGASGFAGNAAYALVIGIGNATGPGTHNLNVFAGGDGSSLIVGSQTTGYGTAFQGGSGTITITSLTANRIVGTFSGTLVPSTGSGASLLVTNGQFNVTF
jgi:hypothetical protein